MNLDNPNNQLRKNNIFNSSVAPKLLTNSSSKIVNLRAPMIDRVHKAKSGCSACGKKVA